MTNIIVAKTKHGTELYESALTLLAERVNDGYWYDNWDDGDPNHQWEDRAQGIVDASYTKDVEDAAWNFLRSRQDHEYEYVERNTVQ